MRLEILHTARTYFPAVDGVARAVQAISEGLASRGHDVTVATGKHPGRDFKYLNGVKVREFNVSGKQVWGYTGDTQSYVEFICSFTGDVMMNYAAQNWNSELVYPMLDDIKCAKVFVPCGYSGLHDPEFSSYYSLMPDVLNRYDHIIYLSDSYQDKHFGDQHEVHHNSVIPNGALAEEFLHKRHGFKEKFGVQSSKMFLCVANYGVPKNQEMVLRAYLEADVRDSILVFIGTDFNAYVWKQLRKDSSMTNLQETAFWATTLVRRHIWNRIFPTHVLRGPSKPGLEVMFLERVSREMIVSAFHEADLFLYGSQIECFPLVILEAMASKTPFISTNCGNVSDLPGGTVVFSVEEMAKEICKLADKGHEWSELAEAGRNAWEMQYTWDKVVDAYEELYIRLCEKREVSRI